MKIPRSSRKKALVIVDVQLAFITDRNRYLIKEIADLIEKTSYELYIDSVFFAEKGSIWDLQKNWVLPKSKETKPAPQIDGVLKSKPRLSVIKSTRSVFRADNVAGTIREKGIQEVHIVGVETNDCVFATAYDAFDIGLVTYVIEEASDSTKPERHDLAAKLLREQGMTNHSAGVTVD